MRRGLIAALVASAIGVLGLRGGPAAAAVDLTGTWIFEVSGEFGAFGQQTLFCTAQLDQDGQDVGAAFECGVANGNGTATLTPQPQGAAIDADLMLDLSSPFSDVNAHATGTVTPDGNSMSGDWTATGFDSAGTFVAHRDPAQYLKGDVNCDGAVDALDALTEIAHLAGAPVFQWPACPGVEEQFASVFGDMNCDNVVKGNDGLRILRYAGGLAVTPPAGCAAVGALVVAAH